MRRPLPAALLAAALARLAVASDVPDLGRVAIAPLDAALTFARAHLDGTPVVLAVTAYEGGVVTGLDVGRLLGRDVADPLDALRVEGWDALRARIAGASPESRVQVPASALGMPLDLRAHHVAAGTNYPEHAGEAEVEDGPFLFAKLVAPTAPRATVPRGDALLDYEVELAFVTLEALAAGRRPERLGLVVCNDYTDRATLLRHVDVWDPTSGKGFTTGKSAPGWLPVGDLFVVPRDVRAFVGDLELRLWVNGALRQRARVADAVWDLDRLLAETWARRDVTWAHRGDAVSLLSPAGTIPDRTLVMSGTPGGTVFRGVPTGTRVRGALAWAWGGFAGPVADAVVETHVRDARAADTYLRAGDRVTIHVERLGVVDNVIVP